VDDPMDVDQEPEASAAAKKIFEDLLEKARDLETTDPQKAKQAYRDIIANKQDLEDPSSKYLEKAIYA